VEVPLVHIHNLLVVVEVALVDHKAFVVHNHHQVVYFVFQDF